MITITIHGKEEGIVMTAGQRPRSGISEFFSESKGQFRLFSGFEFYFRLRRMEKYSKTSKRFIIGPNGLESRYTGNDVILNES